MITTGYRIRTTARPLCAPGIFGQNDNLRFHQPVACPLPSLGSGVARGLSTSNMARLGPFISQGLRLIRQILRAIQAPGSLQFSLVNGSAKPTNGVSDALFVSPVSIHRTPSPAGFHRWNLAKDQKHEEPKSRES